MDILEILEIKKNNFEKIKSLADQQEILVCDDLMQDYLLLSDKRDRIKNEIDSDNKKYRHVFEKANRNEKEIAMAINGEISKVIESIMDVDKRIEQLVNEKKKGIIDEIKGLKKGRKAVKGYGNKKVHARPRFIQKVG